MRFTIRDVLWMMLVLGIALGWLIQAERLNEEITKARIDVERERALRQGYNIPLSNPYPGVGPRPPGATGRYQTSN